MTVHRCGVAGCTSGFLSRDALRQHERDAHGIEPAPEGPPAVAAVVGSFHLGRHWLKLGFGNHRGCES